MPEIEKQIIHHGGGGGGENSNTNSNTNSSSSTTNTVLVGKYEIGRLLGCGAFAKVYHARNTETGQSVAVKCITKQKIVKSGLAAHVKREISIMRMLRHPHIVRIHEVLATKTKIYCVMEFVKGGELFARVAKSRFSEDLSRRYFHQLISAVGYCHSHGVFHRDLKPENLLVDENADLKVSDFGLSAVSSQVRNDGLLHTLCGTPAYVAPEILMKRGYDGAKIDIWSCGVILFVLNAGYLPFNDPNLMVMYRKIYKGEFKVPKWTSPELRQLFSRLLDTNPDTRITIEEIIHDPWFSRGYKQIEFHEFDAKVEKKENRNLNAFDIISFSAGANLSGLINEPGCSSGKKFRFVSAEIPDDIVKKVERFCEREEITVKTREWTVEMLGRNGNLVAGVEVYRLTEELVVVEVRYFEEMWKEKVCGELSGSVYQPVQPDVSS